MGLHVGRKEEMSGRPQDLQGCQTLTQEQCERDVDLITGHMETWT